MANIQIKDRIFYEVDPTVAELFVHAGLATHFMPAPRAKPAAQPEWSIVRLGPAKRLSIRHVDASGAATYWDGGADTDANKIADVFKVRGWNGLRGPTVPKEIVDEYKTRKAEDDDELARALGARERTATDAYSKGGVVIDKLGA